MSEIEAINELLNICDRLLAPDGCPWDREQTMMSTRKCVLEEVCELIEAIDLQDDKHIEEELGDLFFNAIFLSRLAEKETRTTLQQVVKGITEKLIRRHPHIFGDTINLESAEEVIHQWEQIKKNEKGNAARKSALDGIPKDLPALSRASKMIKQVKKHKLSETISDKQAFDLSSEDAVGELLWNISTQSYEKGIDPEHALRKILAMKEQQFRGREKEMLFCNELDT